MWLLEQSILEMLQQAVSAGIQPTAEQTARFEARSFGAEADGPRLLTTAGSSAEIEISGVITKAPDILAMIFGGGNTTYSDINAAIATAEQDDSITDITLKIDSPGGEFDGLFDTIAALQSAKKPINALVSNRAASAAFAIATQADTITAVNRAARFGSVGIVAGFRVDDEVVEITSTEAPKKRPDVTTKAGKAVVREMLDEMHALFVEAIAGGRGTTIEKVNAGFGRGTTFLADEAIKRGMIDDIAGSPLKVVKTPAVKSGGTQTKEQGIMDRNQLKAEHPQLFTTVMQEGVTQERDRVGAFIVAGEQSGDMATALKAISDGSEMTITLSTQFLMAAANRGDVETRSAEEIAAAEAADSADTDAADEDAAADTVASAVESKLGVAKGV